MEGEIVNFLRWEIVNGQFKTFSRCSPLIDGIDNKDELRTFGTEGKCEEQLPYARSNIHHVHVIGDFIVREQMFDDGGTKAVVAKQPVSAAEY